MAVIAILEADYLWVSDKATDFGAGAMTGDQLEFHLPAPPVSGLRLTVSQSRIPPSLKDSLKGPRCVLVTVCLPDKICSLSGSSLALRTIAVPPDEALTLIVQSQHARIGHPRHERLGLIEARQHGTCCGPDSNPANGWA